MKKKNKVQSGAHRFMPWENGAFSRSQHIEHDFPPAFLMLCKLLNVTPAKLIADFADNLACGSWKREGREAIKEKIIDYFLEHGYGQGRYSAQEIREMFQDMEAIGRLFPRGDAKMIGQYGKWRDQYYQYWFKRWSREKQD